jgi:hypothetical protein
MPRRGQPTPAHLVPLGNQIAEAIDDPKAAGLALAALIRQQRDIAAHIQATDNAVAGPSDLAPAGDSQHTG